MSERTPPVTHEADPEEHVLEAGEPHPRGTLVILLLWMAALIGFWGFLYARLFVGG